MLVAPSILSANFNNLLDEVNKVKTADFLHIDVMDGHFVPNISFGTVAYKNLRKYCDLVFDVHLMIEHPLKYASDFAKSGADIITFHYEALDEINEVINRLKELKVKIGISIKPNTEVEVLLPYLDKVDLVLVMSVEPGFGGQKFMPQALEKITKLKKMQSQYHYSIEVDGGINAIHAQECFKAGCDIVVAGTYIFGNEDPQKVIKGLKEII